MSNEVIETVAAMQERSERLRLGGHRIALVPTMGALHDGHLALVREARKHGDVVVLSLFVNPTQFGPGEDLARYPRRPEADLRALGKIGGVDIVFAPSVVEMYPNGTEDGAGATWVEVTRLGDHLCGRHRPGHFRAVATVVAKLLNACKPHAAVFGRKDAQQFVIVRRMVADMLLDVDVVGVPTVRESDGLAMSSRNEYLTPPERAQAPVLHRAISAGSEAVRRGEQRPGALVESMREIIASAPLARIQYVEVVDAQSLQPVDGLASGEEVLLATAVYFGSTRLIESAFVRIP